MKVKPRFKTHRSFEKAWYVTHTTAQANVTGPIVARFSDRLAAEGVDPKKEAESLRDRLNAKKVPSA